MKTIINNWVQQEEKYGLDFSTAKSTVGDYTFDIRYDCCAVNDNVKPTNCGLVLNIQYKNVSLATKFSDSIEKLKSFSEEWLNDELNIFYKTHFISSEQYSGFNEAVRPAMKWLAENCHPHMKIVIESNNAELLEGQKVINTDEYLVD